MIPKTDNGAGNLSSEKVTKRDIFHVFHIYGSLAQISIKQAYGFVQFLEAHACDRALRTEQGRTIRGKKIRESLRATRLLLIELADAWHRLGSQQTSEKPQQQWSAAFSLARQRKSREGPRGCRPLRVGSTGVRPQREERQE